VETEKTETTEKNLYRRSEQGGAFVKVFSAISVPSEDQKFNQ
jgi:hypothetical protein